MKLLDLLKSWALGKPRILLADDDEKLRSLIGEALSLNGYKVSLAHDGAEALDLIKRRRHDLAILDYHMPRLDGMQVLEALRAAPAYRRLPIIMLTSDKLVGTMNKAFEMDVVSFVTKPVSLKDLLEKVRSSLPKK